MNKLQNIIVFLLLLSLVNLSAQEKPCYEKELSGFIKDGQDYALTLENTEKGTIYISFFEGFDYRITICSSNTKKFKIALYDIEKKLLFSGNCENFIKSIDLKFKSNIACIAEISTYDVPVEKPEFTIAVGFRQSKGEKKNKLDNK